MEANRLELDKPVTIAGAGPAVAGGMELVLCCDFRVMEQSTYFGRMLKVYFQATYSDRSRKKAALSSSANQLPSNALTES
tara:strand:- start:2 stop:241 length:240 start_codon:yes stop_codon:yes gene_type:complete